MAITASPAQARPLRFLAVKSPSRPPRPQGLILERSIAANHLLRQARIATFVGDNAMGATFVIPIGQIDLRAPWALTRQAILTPSLTASDVALGQRLAASVDFLAGC